MEHAIELGLSSDEELGKICRFHNCEYYDVDDISVGAYRKNIDVGTYIVMLQDHHLSDDDITPDTIGPFKRGKLKKVQEVTLCTD